MQRYMKESLKSGHVICISEGSAEEVIIKKLFRRNRLIFKYDDIYESDELIRSFSRTRNGKRFAKEKLEMDYGERHINILRILDSKKEKFHLGNTYDERIDSGEIRLFNILTRPEIEILIVINEGHYDRFVNKRDTKACDYCKHQLNMKKVKSAEFVSEYFGDIDILVNSIKEYKRVHSKKDEYCLFNLLD